MKRFPFRLVLTTLVFVLLSGCNENSPVSFESGDDPASLDRVDAVGSSLTAPSADQAGHSLIRAGSGVTAITGPTVITEPGTYRVTNDFASTGDAVVIRADNVVLSLGGYTITGPGDLEGRGIVIEGAEDVIVRDGTLQSFGMGVVLVDTRDSEVRAIRVVGGDQATSPPNVQIGTMLINSRGNRLQRNTYEQLNLGIFVRGSGSADNRIQLNTILAGNNGLLGICYNPVPGEGEAGPSDDTVKLNSILGFQTGIQASVGSTNNLFTLNTIEYLVAPYEDLNGSNTFVRNQTSVVPGS